MRTISIYLTSFLILLSLFSCKGDKRDRGLLGNSNQIIISGVIQNPTKKIVEIFSPEITNMQKFYTHLNEDGSYNLTVNILYPHDLMMRYNNELISIYMHPGDSIYISIDEKDLQNSIKFTGDNSVTNTALSSFFEKFGKLISEERLWYSKSNLDPADFKNYIAQFKTKCDSLVGLITSTFKTNKEIIFWMNTYVHFRCAEELLEYGFHNSKILDNTFYDFINNSGLFEGDPLICSQYYEDYINKYFHYLINNETELNWFSKYWETQDYYSLFDSSVNYFVRNPGNTSEVILTQLCYSIMLKDYHVAGTLLNEFALFVNNDVLIKQLENDLERLKSPSKIKTLDEYVDNNMLSNIFSDLKKLQKEGKVLYIDIYSTWCGPCRKEFPLSKCLYEELNHDKIEFIYLCCQSKTEEWEKIVNEYELEGSNYFLDDKQFAVLSAEFNINGSPRYIFVNKKGEIVSDMAHRPSSPNIRNELAKLINE